ncbi:hypothetical protein EXN61_21580 [Agrobacterium tumefaciens]|uniref:Uncharacterized protein n=1 Tax=Agrobacterium tumefaciens TaxID=358 RepID=A0A546XRT5_AGRTU|nr:hypothetical protein [Agrobacterium tumefaciens]TRB03460.1 hypothetical protein EXN61_21580 [Agrobacterium tumefaciens]
MTNHPRAEAIFAEHGIAVVPAHVMPAVGQVRSVSTLQRILKKRGEEHARFVVMTFAETENSKASINEYSLWAVSDLVLLAEKNFPELVTTDVESWFRFFDGLPFGWVQLWAADMDGIVPKRFAMVGMIYERMKRYFGPLRVQPDMFDDRYKSL